MATKMIECAGGCGVSFEFTERDQEFYAERGWTLPKRCRTCREAQKAERAKRKEKEIDPAVANELDKDMKELLEDMMGMLNIEVEVNSARGENSSIFEIKAEKDAGILIGRDGSMALALRTFVQAAGRRNDRAFTLELIVPENGKEKG